jgi:outer membrane lipoprotein-sorting protein
MILYHGKRLRVGSACMLLLLAALSLVSWTAQAWTLQDVQSHLAKQSIVRADFEQARWIGGVDQPLRSNGHVVMSRSQGLWWQQNQPFALRLVLTDSRMLQQLMGQAPEVISAETSPQLFHVVHLLRAVLQADQAALEQNFELHFTDQGNKGWQLRLVPKAAPLDKLFSSIELSGTDYLRTVVLNDRQGDHTNIHFSAPLPGPDTLSDAETRQFKF